MKGTTKVKKEQDLGSDNIGKLMFTLAVPAITAQLVNCSIISWTAYISDISLR